MRPCTASRPSPPRVRDHGDPRPGAGGQNINKVSNAVHLRFDIRASSLPADHQEAPAAAARPPHHARRRGGDHAQQHRSLEANREEAVRRLHELVRSVATPPRVRRATRPTLASRRRRLAGKSQRSALKAQRGKVVSSASRAASKPHQSRIRAVSAGRQARRAGGLGGAAGLARLRRRGGAAAAGGDAYRARPTWARWPASSASALGRQVEQVEDDLRAGRVDGRARQRGNELQAFDVPAISAAISASSWRIAARSPGCDRAPHSASRKASAWPCA